MIKKLLGVSFAVAFALIAFTPLVSAVSDIFSATVTEDGSTLDAAFVTTTKINKGGQDGAFGYGVVTLDGLGGSGDSLMAATTHKGVLDSEKQNGDQFSPVWHTHYVQLDGTTASDYCESTNGAAGLPALEVATLSFEEPGKVKVKKQTQLFLEDMPRVFDGTNALTGSPLTWTPETDADLVVQFTLRPVDDDGNTTLDFTHVCVENVIPFVLEDKD